MCRIDSMSRFPEQEIVKPLSYCVNCNNDFYENDYVYYFDGEHFCDLDCLKEYYDIREIMLQK